MLLFPPLSHGVCSTSCPLNQWCYLTTSSSATPSPFPFDLSQHQDLFQWVSASLQLPKYWSFRFNNRAPNEYSGLISFRIDWFNLIFFQETLKSLLQYHNSKASILQCSDFFMAQLPHLYMIIRKTISLTKWVLLAKWCLCFLTHCLGLS